MALEITYDDKTNYALKLLEEVKERAELKVKKQMADEGIDLFDPNFKEILVERLSSDSDIIEIEAEEKRLKSLSIPKWYKLV
ncbi:MAG: hypothetical protein CL760_05335 [Chloroflexi bacterium]|mgnify:CR=1 FL=1|nr:hypothetical protein [Chloroflexota bacterium]|tara:strand:+ start:28500 stop:28745 length:246 start_codon:yes stop_codon:yes gene_type:complete